MLCNFERTSYPFVYAKTYWGVFEHTPHEHNDVPPHIFDNRNSFVRDYQIKRVQKTFRHKKEFDKLHSGSNYDHVEYYLTTDKRTLMVVNPYTRSNLERTH